MGAECFANYTHNNPKCGGYGQQGLIYFQYSLFPNYAIENLNFINY